MAFIDWSALGRLDWDVLVENLLYRMYDTDGNEVTVFEGTGGDGGRDVVVDFANGTKQIFQLKHFPGGFSGGFVKRREQIDGSYKAAMKHDPDIWTLVVPENLKAGELEWLQKLVKHPTPSAKMPSITKMGRTELNNELAKFKDLQDAFERKESWDDFATKWNADRRIAPGTPSEVQERVAHTQEAIDAGDLNWTWGISTIKGMEAMVLQPKHPRAYEVSPVSLHLAADPAQMSPELLESMRDVLEFGLDGTISLPPEAVHEFTVKGPPFVAESSRHVGIEITSPLSPPEQNQQVTIELKSKAGKVMASHPATVEHVGGSIRGMSMRLSLCNGAGRLRLKSPQDNFRPTDVGLTTVLEHASAADARDLFEFTIDLFETDGFEIVLPEGSRFPYNSAGMGKSSITMEHLREDRDFAVDLDQVQSAFRQRFSIPMEAGPRDRAVIRTLRLLLDGRRTTIPDVAEVQLTLSGDEPGEILQAMMDGEASQLWWPMSTHKLVAFGRVFELAQFVVGAPEVILVNRAEIANEYRQRLTEHKAVVRPRRGGFFSGFAPEYLLEEGVVPVLLTPWGLPSMFEPGDGPEISS